MDQGALREYFDARLGDITAQIERRIQTSHRELSDATRHLEAVLALTKEALGERAGQQPPPGEASR